MVGSCFLKFNLCLFVTNTLLDLFVLFLLVLCLFACFCLFDHMLSCLFDSFAWLVVFLFLFVLQ